MLDNVVGWMYWCYFGGHLRFSEALTLCKKLQFIKRADFIEKYLIRDLTTSNIKNVVRVSQAKLK